MRKYGLCLSILFLAVAFMFTTAHALGIKEGNSVTFSFHELVLLSTGYQTGTPRVGVWVDFYGDGLLGGEGIRFEIFDELTDQPIIVDWGPFPPFDQKPGHRMGIGFGAGGAMTDLDGFVRVTMLSGSVNLRSITFEIVDQYGFQYRQTLSKLRSAIVDQYGVVQTQTGAEEE